MDAILEDEKSELRLLTTKRIGGTIFLMTYGETTYDVLVLASYWLINKMPKQSIYVSAFRIGRVSQNIINKEME